MKKVSLFTVLILASFLSESQGVLSINGANSGVPTLYVSSGANVYVSGGINIAQAGSSGAATGDYLQNNGTIRVAGGPEGQNNLNNDVNGLKTYTNGQTTGTIIFSAASQVQNITGGGTVDFMNLTVNNTSSPGVDLEENITVDGILDLGGVINLQGSNLSLSGSGTLAGAPYSASNMIQADSTGQFIGGVASGAGSYLFPVGDGSPAYTPVTINLVTNASAGTIGINLRPVAEANINNPNAASDYIKRYWTFSNTGLSNYTYTGNFNYLPGDITGTESLMKISRWANPWYSEQSSSAGSNTLTIGNALDQILAPLNGDFTGRNTSCSTSAGTITAAKDSICLGSSQTLAIDGNTSAVQWQSSLTGNNYASIAGADSTAYLAGPAQTTYYRTYASGNTCSDTSIAFKLVVNALPTPSTPTTSKDTICSGDSTQICAGNNYSSYLWNTGATTTCIEANEAGGYWVSVTDQNGCTNYSAHAEIAAYRVSSVSIIQQGDTLSSFGAYGYQWDLNGNLIPGATSDYYVATQSGEYSVQITDGNGCQATSSDVLITLGINNVTANSEVEIYPNPASGSFNIKYTGPAINNCQVTLLDMPGARVMERNLSLSHAETIQINVRELPKGIYLLQMQSEDMLVVRKMLVQ